MEPAKSLIEQLRAAMHQQGINQLGLSEKLKISPSTMSRALETERVSGAVFKRAEAWLLTLKKRDGSDEELHLLRKSISLLQSAHEKLDALATMCDAKRSGDVAND
ncbi:hypothetical protein A6768_19310 [Sphingobium yanoikuyae]|uniref:Uncharacterized protein n=1 Tax=Sphingobium yanoikuyae TaxID=13690 RepID=A0A291N467_SPHYA|nr:hypothetical protein A6768_19310 [Sphingobium yanoikuyae]